MQKVVSTVLTIVFFGSILVMESCRKDPVFNTDPNFRLEFSTDTIRFDTVFTSLGSTTFWLQVYNRSNKDIDIQTIELAGGDASAFRMNVNGDTSLLQSRVRLRAKDSLFVFVRVTIDPNDTTNPFEVLDYIRFSFNNHSQEVVLLAFGQNAIYHRPTDTCYYHPTDTLTIERDGKILQIPYSIAVQDSFLNIEKPHVIYGYLLVRDTLTLNAGTRLHFAPNAGLIVANGGSLRVNGEFEKEVIFDGMRLDADYRNTTGQWNRIWFMSGSIDNRINWAIIRNGRIGLLIDSIPNLSHQFIIENTIIDNMQNHGIFAQHTALRGSNLQVSNCGERLLALYGGEYRFEHCTFANYFSSSASIRRTASVLLDSISLHPLTRADFTSCIIYGLLQEELEIRLSSSQNINFSHCNIRTRRTANDRIFEQCIINSNPYFKTPSNVNGNFDIAPQPIETSGVIRKGRPYSGVSYDLKSRPRTPSIERPAPTIGAYEFTE